MDNQNLIHSRYNCTYYIFLFQNTSKNLCLKIYRENNVRVCRMRDEAILKAATLSDHVHMYATILLKLSLKKAVC